MTYGPSGGVAIYHFPRLYTTASILCRKGQVLVAAHLWVKVRSMAADAFLHSDRIPTEL